jgi:hypothetical protein
MKDFQQDLCSQISSRKLQKAQAPSSCGKLNKNCVIVTAGLLLVVTADRASEWRQIQVGRFAYFARLTAWLALQFF